MQALGIVEIGKKQKYIFQSNRLSEIVGASMIIREISERFTNDLDRVVELPFWSEKNIVLEGGGHSIYYFETMEEGKAFNRYISQKVLKDFPGVELNCKLISFDSENDRIDMAIDKLFKTLAEKKDRGPIALRQLSFGIERLCDSSQLPAERFYPDKDADDRRAVSPEILCKLNFAKEHKPERYFVDLFPDKPYHLAKINVDMDVLGTDEKRKVAVVHIDGNGMGNKVNTFKELNHKDVNESIAAFNQRYKESFRSFSKAIDIKYKSAFRKMIERIEAAVLATKESDPLFVYQKGINVRPIIFAGDDISFILPGNLGVEAARIMLEELQNSPLVVHGLKENKKMMMYAAAGIAIVKFGYPFSIAHELAEQLCANAKSKLARDVANGRISGDDASILDFHILNGSWECSLSNIRTNNYKIEIDGKTSNLTMKPMYVMGARDRQKSDQDVYDFSFFQKSMKRILSPNMARSKIKRLREHIILGPGETMQYLKLTDPDHRLTNSFPPLSQDDLFTSSPDSTCLYFDAIEAMDDVLILSDKEEIR